MKIWLDIVSSGDTQDEPSLYSLVTSLPQEHAATLRHVVLHLRRVCHNDQAAADAISAVFGELLMRPSWNSIVLVINHSTVLARLWMQFDLFAVVPVISVVIIRQYSWNIQLNGSPFLLQFVGLIS